jgi:hypothetical protein
VLVDWFCFVLFSAVLGFELRAFVLARQTLYHLTHISNPFCSGYFRDKILLFAQARLDFDNIFTFPTVSEMTGVPHRTYLFASEIGSQRKTCACGSLEPMSASSIALHDSCIPPPHLPFG